MTNEEIDFIITNIVKTNDNNYHTECYKRQLLNDYKNGWTFCKKEIINDSTKQLLKVYKADCTLCKKEIINNNMTKQEIKNIFTISSNMYHSKCYKQQLLIDYKNGCTFCKKEIINDNMTINEIIKKIKCTQKERTTIYHQKCYIETNINKICVLCRKTINNDSIIDKKCIYHIKCFNDNNNNIV